MISVVEPRAVGWIIAHFVLALAGVMFIPLGYALVTGGDDLGALILSVIVTAGAGGALFALSRSRPERELKLREGILVAALVWASVCLFGALPFYFSPYFASFTDALFESASGFTTTGATVLANVEVLSPPIQLWRHFSQWVGGMGIVLLGVAILPLLGQGGVHLYRAEFSGAKSQRLTPRVVETAQALWKIYVALTFLEILALHWAGMGIFDAVCHAFTTLATGGFSTRNASIGGFHSDAIDYIVISFMLVSGISFIQHYRLWVERDPRTVARDYELRDYLLIILTASAVIAVVLIGNDGLGWAQAVRAALFQVVSIVTTTGYVTQDFAVWYPLAQFVLVILMFVGGCTGSTAGGLKVARISLLGRVVDREFRRMAEPQGVFTVRLSGEPIPEVAVHGLLNLVYLAWLLNLLASLVLTATGVDILTAITAVAACVFNVGPGLSGVGPAENYGNLPVLAKWILAFCMIAGRLEFYTLLVIFTSAFWRR
jgi:trk system potassium uptake protein TrkH